MRQLRRWVPGPVREAVELGTPPVISREDKPLAKDLEFCSKLAFHGGVALSEEGFGAESELVRLRQAGLLELQRDQAPPFGVTRVALSHKARALLAGQNRVSSAGSDPGDSEKTVAILDTKRERLLRRHGFEVARGMISAVVRTELASWNEAEQAGEVRGPEAQVLMRISQIVAPFGP